MEEWPASSSRKPVWTPAAISPTLSSLSCSQSLDDSLQVEEALILAAHPAQGLPVLRPQPVGVRAAAGERPASDLLVDAGQGLVELALLVEPNAADLVKFVNGDGLDGVELLRAVLPDALLHLQHAA